MPDIPLPWLLGGLCALQALLAAGKIFAVAGWLDGEQGLALELTASSALLLGLAALARPALGTAGALLIAVVGALLQLGVSLTGLAIANALDIGEDDVPLPPDYPPLAALLLALIALALPGSPFEDARDVYLGALVLTAGAFALVTGQREAAGGDEDDPVSAASLYLAGAAIGGGAYLAAAYRLGPGRGLVVASLLVGLTSLLQLLLAFFTSRLADRGAWDPLATPRACTIHAGCGLLAAAAMFGGRFV